MNKWRTVRYTDDGCYLYQCLNCKNQWESRNPPGWFDMFVDTPVLVKGGYSYTERDGTERCYAERAEPEYRRQWTYCPCCGIKWEGPVRSDVDNERMLGERRLRIERAVRKANRSPRKRDKWIIETRSSWDGYEGYWEIHTSWPVGSDLKVVLKDARNSRRKSDMFPGYRSEYRIRYESQSDY